MNTSPSDTKYLVKAWSLNAISTLMKSGNESYSFFILPITRESIYGFLELWKFTQILIKQLWQKVQLENSKPEFPRKKNMKVTGKVRDDRQRPPIKFHTAENFFRKKRISNLKNLQNDLILLLGLYLLPITWFRFLFCSKLLTHQTESRKLNPTTAAMNTIKEKIRRNFACLLVA